MRSADFIKTADILAKQHRIIVRKDTEWKAHIKTREVFYNAPDIYTLPNDHVLGLLLHEIAHIRYTTDAGAEEKKAAGASGNQGLLHNALNHLEDISIEHLIALEYPNAGDILKDTERELLDVLLGLLPKLHISEHERALLYGTARFRGRGYPTPLAPYEVIGEEVYHIMQRHRATIYGRRTTAELVPAAEEITKLLEKKLGAMSKERKAELLAAAEGDHHSGNACGQGSDGGKSIRDQLVDELRTGGTGWGSNLDNLNPGVTFIDELADQAALIGRRLRQVLKRNQAMEFGGRYRAGKLLPKRMRRVVIQKDRRPFARRIVKSNQSYAFAVMTDVSGSMYAGRTSREPIAYAMTGLFMMAEALRIAGVKRALFLFADRAERVSPIGTRPILWTDLNDQLLMQKAGGGTDIGGSMKVALKELTGTQAEHKYLIVITDGESSPHEIQAAHAQAAKLGIECIAITLGGSGTLEDIFGGRHNASLKGGQGLKIGESLITILKDTITRG